MDNPGDPQKSWIGRSGHAFLSAAECAILGRRAAQAFRGAAICAAAHAYFLRRSRLAFAVALACQGASSDAGDGAFRDRASKAAERPNADVFSCTIRAY